MSQDHKKHGISNRQWKLGMYTGLYHELNHREKYKTETYESDLVGEVLCNTTPDDIDARAQFPRAGENALKVKVLRLLAVGSRSGCQSVCASHHLLEGAEAESCHVATDVLSQHEHEVDDVLGRATELLAQNGILQRE